MRTRLLGRSGLRVSEIGFGAWGIGGVHPDAPPAYGETDDRQSLEALASALDHGITFYDSSDLYGLGHSERLLGQAFARRRSEVVLASKLGYTGQGQAQDFSSDRVRRCLENSLERLQTDYLDLYQLHDAGPDTLERYPDLPALLQTLRDEGLIRAFGISLRTPDDGIKLLDSADWDCLQLNFNLVDQRLLHSPLLERCQQRGIGLIVRTPLCFGFLTGQYAPDTRLPAGDHRQRWPQAQLQRWHEAITLFRQDLSLSEYSDAQFALAFCLSYPISTCIPGMLSSQQVHENAQAGVLPPLTPDQRVRLESIYQQHSFYAGSPA
ncbi:MAG: aldo/keto reductase [Candidatus Sericytochromatia bacterium]